MYGRSAYEFLGEVKKKGEENSSELHNGEDLVNVVSIKNRLFARRSSNMRSDLEELPDAELRQCAIPPSVTLSMP